MVLRAASARSLRIHRGTLTIDTRRSRSAVTTCRGTSSRWATERQSSIVRDAKGSATAAGLGHVVLALETDADGATRLLLRKA